MVYVGQTESKRLPLSYKNIYVPEFFYGEYRRECQSEILQKITLYQSPFPCFSSSYCYLCTDSLVLPRFNTGQNI